MSASTSTAPATHACLVAVPAVAAPFAPAADTVEHATGPPASVKSDVPIADSNASSAPRRGAPMRRTATYLDLRAWPGYAAAVGLPEPPRMPKSFYYSNHFTKTKWGSMDPIPMPKMEKKRVDKKAKVITGPVDWAKFKTMKGIKKQHAVTNGKVDETPLTKGEKKLAKRFRARYDLRRVKERVTRLKGAAKYAASVAAARALAASQASLATPVSVAPVAPVNTTTPAEVDPLMPGAFPEESDDTPAAAQTHLATDDDSPSLGVALLRLAVEVVAVMTKRKRVDADDEAEARGLKRRRVEANGPSQSRAAGRPIAGKPARNTSTGATAPTHNESTATAATSAARKAKKLKATLSKCPPPPPLAPVAGNKKLEATVMTTPALDAPGKNGSALARQPAVEPEASSSSAPAAATRAMPLSRQATLVIDNAGSLSSAPSTAAAQPNRTALLSEAPTIIDFGLPSSSASAEGVNGLSRQPAVVFNFGATARSSASTSTSTPSFVPFTTTGFLPPLWALKQGSASSSSNTTLAPSSSSKTSRGSRGGARVHKLQEHKEAKRGREDKDDGAASA